MTELVAQDGWEARLRLAFAHDGERTVLSERVHLGPLRVQRPFYPEPGGVCHVYVLHPPGGIVGGDQLTLDVDVARGAHALLTTPAATKLYRSGGATAVQRQVLRVAGGAQLEWLPQETIVWSGVRAELHTRVELSAQASFIGWEMLCLGRPASDERFTSGQLVQRIELLREGKPLLLERGAYRGGDAVLDAAWGLRGQPVLGTFACVSSALREEHVLAAREACAPHATGALASLSLLDQLLVARYLGPSTEQARACFMSLWETLRPVALGCAANAPRIWAT